LLYFIHDIPLMLVVEHRISVIIPATVVAVREASSLRLQDVIGLMLGDEVAA
jgi:hypothetical protein